MVSPLMVTLRLDSDIKYPEFYLTEGRLQLFLSHLQGFW